MIVSFLLQKNDLIEKYNTELIALEDESLGHISVRKTVALDSAGAF